MNTLRNYGFVFILIKIWTYEIELCGAKSFMVRSTLKNGVDSKFILKCNKTDKYRKPTEIYHTYF